MYSYILFFYKGSTIYLLFIFGIKAFITISLFFVIGFVNNILKIYFD